MDRTVQIHLQPNSEQAAALHETLEQFTMAYNAVCSYGWNHQEKNGVKLHHATYRETKVLCPTLVSDLLIQARVKATETLKSAFTWKVKREKAYPKQVEKAQKQGKPVPVFKAVKCPCSGRCAIRYNVHTYTLNWSIYWDSSQTSAMSFHCCYSIQRHFLSYLPSYLYKYCDQSFQRCGLINS